MKAKDKERLVVCRPKLLQSLDVTNRLIPELQGCVFTKDECYHILKDPRRRAKTTKLLDILEKKTSDDYNIFLGVLEQYYPHMYLSLTSDVNDLYRELESLNSHMTPLERCRDFIVEEVDTNYILPKLKNSAYITCEEIDSITQVKDKHIRTETLLDLVEMKSNKFYKEILEAIGQAYPHVYLELVDQESDSDDG